MKITEVTQMDTSNDDLDDSLILFQKEVTQLIQNKIFLGKYSERRYVESLQAYRDIIIVESSEDIITTLNDMRKALKTYASNEWIGITNNPDNPDSDDICLWVQLNNVTIGKHWFQISAIKFETKEIILEVEHVQSFRSPNNSIIGTTDPDFPTFNIKEIFTYRNFCEASKFSAIVIMVLLSFTVEALRYLGEYSIKLGYMIVHFMRVSTPIWLKFIDFLTKCVGGFYWLIYVMFRGTPNDPVVPRALMANQKQIGYSTPSYRSTGYGQGDYSGSRLSYSDSRSDWSKYDKRL